jgi:serine/threonine protein kinase
LEYVHNHKIVHRDLKPENLLLDKQRMIKLIDFGLADDMQDGHRLEGLEHGGSPSYLAPEVIIDDEDVPIDFAVDIWSLGVVLYALLAGALPFSGETVEDEDGCPEEDLNSLFQAIVTGEYTVPDFVSEDAKELLDGMLTADPTERLTTPQIRQTRWYQRFIDGDNEAGATEKEVEAVRPEILDEMKKTTKYDTQKVQNEIETGLFSAGTAHYALLCVKNDRAAPHERHQPAKADKPGAADGANGAQVVANMRIGEPIGQLHLPSFLSVS